MSRHRASRIARLLLPLVALMLAFVASAADAQSPKSDLPGASATPPSIDKSTRPQLIVVGSTTTAPFAEWAIKQLKKQYELADPTLKFEGTSVGFAQFCAGLGPQYPDIAGASRPMRQNEFDECQTNGVRDIIEVRIGRSAIVVVTKKGDPVFNVTPRMFYEALAAEVPEDGVFEPNKVKLWSETTKDKTVPALPIKVLLPGRATGQRGFFNDRFLQGGCRHVPEIDAIFAADERVNKCTTLRTDVIADLPEPLEQTTIKAMQTAAPGTLAVTDLLIYKNDADQMVLLPVNGALPTHESIDNYSYIAANPMIFYFKRGHMRNNEGKGVVRGIREFMAAITTDEAIGKSGVFAKMGLEPYDAQEIAETRANVRQLRRYTR